MGKCILANALPSALVADVCLLRRAVKVRAFPNNETVHAQVITLRPFTEENLISQVPGWRNKGWKLASGKPVINREDFEEVLKAQEGIEVTWTHVAGHAGIHGNEMADRLAVAGMDKSREDSGSPQS